MYIFFQNIQYRSSYYLTRSTDDPVLFELLLRFSKIFFCAYFCNFFSAKCLLIISFSLPQLTLPVQHSVLNVEALVGAVNQEKALARAFSVIVRYRFIIGSCQIVGAQILIILKENMHFKLLYLIYTSNILFQT